MFVAKCINFLLELFFLPAQHVGHRAQGPSRFSFRNYCVTTQNNLGNDNSISILHVSSSDSQFSKSRKERNVVHLSVNKVDMILV